MATLEHTFNLEHLHFVHTVKSKKKKNVGQYRQYNDRAVWETQTVYQYASVWSFLLNELNTKTAHPTPDYTRIPK